jgi:antitoxin VapB
MPGLNIKNAETYRLVRRLADATGESMTEAVTEAVRERLERLERVERDFKVADVLDMAHEIRERLPPGYLDQDFDDLLYDEEGLPK